MSSRCCCPDAAGNLYGTAAVGGSYPYIGVVFKLAPDRTYRVLHDFAGGKDDGANPAGGLTLDPATGDLFGTTEGGGGGGCGETGGCGTIYRIAADGTFSLLHRFNGGKDGENPVARLIRDQLGNLYGVASAGGPGGAGTVFQLRANGKFKMLHAFIGSDGAAPIGGLQRDRAGNLYGATQKGGDGDCGTVFQLAPDGTHSILHRFSNGDDGGYQPGGGLTRDKQGNLYGVTYAGGPPPRSRGVVFKLAPDGAYTVLHSFERRSRGWRPIGDLLRTGSGKLIWRDRMGWH